MAWRNYCREPQGTGYLVGTAIFGVIFVAAVLVQIKAKQFHPFLYWLTIVATTTVGTTLADYCTRSLGIGYTGGSTILLILVIASLLAWRWSTGSISVETVNTPKVEIFYWVTIMFSQTLEHGTRRLGSGYQRNGLPRGCSGFWWFASSDRTSLLLHEHFARYFVLGGIHLDPPPRSRRRRFWISLWRRRAGSKPLYRISASWC